MIGTILFGVSAVLYLAGLAVTAEYLSVIEESHARSGLPQLPTAHRVGVIIAWPFLAIAAMFARGK